MKFNVEIKFDEKQANDDLTLILNPKQEKTLLDEHKEIAKQVSDFLWGLK